MAGAWQKLMGGGRGRGGAGLGPPPGIKPPQKREEEMEIKKKGLFIKHGNKMTNNLENRLRLNIMQSAYFKELYEIRTYEEVVDEIYNVVEHVEPWIPRTSTPSEAFCLMYKLMTMETTINQLRSIIIHQDSPYIRAVGFLYLRYVCDPKLLWEWFEPFVDDNEMFSPRQHGAKIPMGKFVRDLLLELKFLDTTVFPRIPVMTMQMIRGELDGRPLPTPGPPPVAEDGEGEEVDVLDTVEAVGSREASRARSHHSQRGESGGRSSRSRPRESRDRDRDRDSRRRSDRDRSRDRDARDKDRSRDRGDRRDSGRDDHRERGRGDRDRERDRGDRDRERDRGDRDRRDRDRGERRNREREDRRDRDRGEGRDRDGRWRRSRSRESGRKRSRSRDRDRKRQSRSRSPLDAKPAVSEEEAHEAAAKAAAAAAKRKELMEKYGSLGGGSNTSTRVEANEKEIVSIRGNTATQRYQALLKRS